jgi:hypothetical protein
VPTSLQQHSSTSSYLKCPAFRSRRSTCFGKKAYLRENPSRGTGRSDLGITELVTMTRYLDPLYSSLAVNSVRKKRQRRMEKHPTSRRSASLARANQLPYKDYMDTSTKQKETEHKVSKFQQL